MARENAMPRRYNLRPLPSRKKMNICIPYLPPEIIFSILLFLPAEVLYNVMRYVCREWYNIISSPTFIDAHLVRSSRGILFSQVFGKRFVHYLGMEKHDAKMTELYPSSSTFPGTILTSCNGLVLLTKLGSFNLYVGNPITKEIVTLPCIAATFMRSLCSRLAYAPCSKKYKVVHFYVKGTKVECKILTVNVDKRWRCLSRKQEALISEKMDGLKMFFHRAISTEGFVHVTLNELPYTLTLDVETEKLYISTTPKILEMGRREYSAMGNFLSLMDWSNYFLRHIWVLTDVEAGKWIKVASVNFGSQRQWLRFCGTGFRLVHVGYLNDGELVIFHVSNCRDASHFKKNPQTNCISYNVNTGAVNLLQLDEDAVCKGKFLPHVKSLVSPKCI